MYTPTAELYYIENPIKIKYTVPEIAILVMLKTIKYKENWMLSLAQFKNQY